jgi:hypothetical protein
MRARMGGPLRMFSKAAAPGLGTAPPSVEASPVATVELTVYAGDSVAFGRLPLTAERVTDLMNDGTDFEFADTFVQSLDDSHGLLVREVVVSRDEIFAVAVAGPRGDPMRRTRTRPIPVELRLGRYDVSGNIHVVPGTTRSSASVVGGRWSRSPKPRSHSTRRADEPSRGSGRSS